MQQLEEYARLHGLHARFGTRLKYIGGSLKATLEPGQYPVDDKVVVITLKRGAPQVDDTALTQLLIDKGLWDVAKKEVPDHDIVEGLYIEGLITDEDLRSINGGSRVIPAISVTDKPKEGEEIVQGNDEGIR